MAARPPLFRPEAMPAGESGAPIGTRPLSWIAIAALLAITIIIAAGFAALARVSRTATLEGYLQPAGGALRVTAPRDGVLRRLYAGEGQYVAGGSPLILIDAPSGLEGGGSLAEARRQTFTAQAASVGAQIDGERRASAIEAERIRARLDGLRSEARSLGEQRQVQVERLAVTAERLKTLQPIRAKGYISEDEFRNREEYLLSLRQGLSALDRQLADNRRQQGEAAAELAKVPQALAERTAALRADIAGLDRGRAEAGAEGALLVRAPAPGRISALRVRPGQAVTQGAPMLTLAPGAGELRAIVFAAPAVVGLVRPGQRVRLIYDAFPAARFGAQEGIVTNVSTAVVPQDEAEGPARYRIEIAPDPASTFEAARLLQQDMTVKADIELEKRSLLEWIFEPLLTAWARR